MHRYLHTHKYTHTRIHNPCTHAHTHIHTYRCTHIHKQVKGTQLCLTLCYPMDFTIHGILQARILEWAAVLFSRGSSQPRNGTQVSHCGQILYQLSHQGNPGILEWVAYPFSRGSSQPRGGTQVSLWADSLPAELTGKPTHKHIHVSPYTPCTHASHTHPHTHPDTHTQMCTHTTHTHTHTYIYMHIHIWTYTRTHIHTHVHRHHTHTHTPPLLQEPQEPWGLRSEAPLLRQTLGPLAPPVGLRFSLDPSGPSLPLPRLPSQTAHVQVERRGRRFLSPPRGSREMLNGCAGCRGWGDPCHVNDTRG